jgi:hypothetical protein
MTLGEIGARSGGIKYKAVGKAIKRHEDRILNSKATRRLAETCLKELANFVTPPLVDAP